ncbi:MAG: phosphoribosylanthranilate isomerase [Odoribacter sp.]|nr:phosphoribosylanthranilate isomerase [Odoribacter sp.]
MLIKVCGMRDAANIKEIAALQPDMMGFIFYSPSPRHAGEMDTHVLNSVPENIKPVGVFVNESKEKIEEIIKKYKLPIIQLHGNETPEECKYFRQKGLKVIKAIGIKEEKDLEQAVKYESVCDLLLFDTKSEKHGGTGESFDWDMLESYQGNTPFLLSGGIKTEDMDKILSIKHPQLIGVDLNSRFEISPGLKDGKLLEKFIKGLRKQKHTL